MRNAVSAVTATTKGIAATIGNAATITGIIATAVVAVVEVKACPKSGGKSASGILGMLLCHSVSCHFVFKMNRAHCGIVC